MKLTTSTTLTSKLHPEVSYEVRSLSEGRRQKFIASVADLQYRLYELAGQHDALLPVEGKEEDPQQKYKRMAVVDQWNEVNNEVRSAWIRHYVIKISGLEIDGEPATVESFLANAPSDLFVECVELVKGQAELSPDESKN